MLNRYSDSIVPPPIPGFSQADASENVLTNIFKQQDGIMADTRSNPDNVVRGLEGVVAAETDISFVDGVNSNLYYKGYSIHDIATHPTAFAEIVYLLLNGEMPTSSELAEIRAEIVAEMDVPDEIVSLMEMFPLTAHPMDILRTCVSALASFDPDGPDNTIEASRRKGIRLIAKFPTLIARLYRIRRKKEIIPPNPKLNMAANFLYMMHGEVPTETNIRAMDLVLLLHADHGLNASTFAARVTASTQADIHSAVTTAISTLKGPLHGGANERVMKMLKEINNVDEVEEYINTMLSQGQRVMGFGHRVYKKEDPRAQHLRRISEELCSLSGHEKLYRISHRIENIVLKTKGIYPNVDFYSATVQHALGIPARFYTTVFAISRVSGWVAHVLDQYKNNRLIRPTSKYIGEYNRPFIPIEKRISRKKPLIES